MTGTRSAAEWKTVRAGDIGRFGSGSGFPVRYQGRTEGDYPFFKVSDMNRDGNDVFLVRSANYITDHTRQVLGAVAFPAKSIVFAKVGAAVFLDRKRILVQPSCLDNNMAAFVPTDERVDPSFVYFLLLTIRFSAFASTTALPALSGAALSGIQLSLPPLREQRAIAAVLSDVDELIGSLEALIAKKRAIKQAAMQDLLAGRTRLPGFAGKWRTVRLGEVGATYGGLAGKTAADFGAGNARYVSFLDVLEKVVLIWREFDRVRVSEAEAQNRVARDDLLFNATSETPDELAMGSVVALDGADHELYLNSFCFGFRVADREYCDPFFLGYWSRGFPGRKAVRALAQGATRYNLSKNRFLELGLALPPLAEQRAITGVLSDMDAEIAALERRLDKTRAIKQGVMQQLLSGSIRLPVADYDAQDTDAYAA